MKKLSDIQWCKDLFESLNDGGKWAVPRSGLIFTKSGDKLVLDAMLPGFNKEDQDSEFDLIREYFFEAGISVKRKESRI